jgi:hypothetical protein
MVFTIVMLLAAAPKQDVARAERLYEQARYDDALDALGASCADTASPAECERVRAFIYAALGRDDEARAAFGRMIEAKPDATLPNDVSPRLRHLFDDAHTSQGALTELTVDAIDVLSARGPWVVKVRPPVANDLNSIVVYIAPSGSDAFQPVTLAPEGDSWVGTFRPASGNTGTARYFIETKLASGNIVVSGSNAVPRQIPAIVGEGGDTTPIDDGPGGPSEPGFMDRLAQKTGLPKWALWTIGGGAAAAIIGGATITYFALRDPEPGAIRVRVEGAD